MLKSFMRRIRARFYIIDHKLGIDYLVWHTYDTSRKAELLITRHYRAVILGFEDCFYGRQIQSVASHKIYSFCLLGIHVSFYSDSASLIETVDGRLLNATTREFIKRKVMP